jgi:hypothetical protein
MRTHLPTRHIVQRLLQGALFVGHLFYVTAEILAHIDSDGSTILLYVFSSSLHLPLYF